MKLIIVTLALLVFFTTAQNCSYAAVKTGLQKFNKLSQSLKNRTAEFNPTKFNQDLNKFSASALNCVNSLAKFVNFKAKIANVTETTDCYKDQKTNAWKKDPCCNEELNDLQCCRARNTSFQYLTIDTFKPLLAQRCRNKARVKIVIYTFLLKFLTRIQLCKFRFLRKLRKELDYSQRLLNCFTEQYISPPQCKQNSDCFSNSCDFKKGTCVVNGIDNTDGVLNCMLQRIPDKLKRVFRVKLGLNKRTNANDFRKAFSKKLTHVRCIGSTGFSDREDLRNRTACLAEKKCNLDTRNNKTCSGPRRGFCGSGCIGSSGICKQDVTAYLSTERKCNTFGICVGQPLMFGRNPPRFWEKQTCENGTFKFCNLPECNKQANCTRGACEKLGRCVGFPKPHAICVFGTIYDKQTQTTKCPAMTSDDLIGCIHKTIKTNVACTIAKGKFIRVPRTQVDCEGIKKCFGRDSKYTRRPNLVCKACGGIYKSLYRWQAGQWINSHFQRPFRWKNQTVVPVRKWAMALNLNGLLGFINQLIYVQALPHFRTFVECAYGSIFQLSKEFACNCALDRPSNGTLCNALNKPKKSVVATFRAFSELSETFDFSDVSIKTTNKTVKGGEEADVDIERLEEEKASTVAVMLNNFEDFPVHEITLSSSQNDLLAQQLEAVVVSDGYALSTNFDISGGVTLCIKRSVTSAPVDPSYNQAAFATNANGVYSKSAVPLVNTENGYASEMCATVTDKQTYYMAFFRVAVPSNSSGSGPRPNPSGTVAPPSGSGDPAHNTTGKPGTSGSKKLVVSSVVLAVVAFFIF